MKLFFAFFMALFGFIVTLGIFPPAKAHLDGFIDDVMPGLGFSDTLAAYVSFLPYVLFAILLIASFWVIVVRR